MMTYEQFLANKGITSKPCGIEPSNINPKLFDFQRDITKWALRRGKAAVFSGCGTGKTAIEVQWADQVKTHGRVLIGIARQYVTEANKFGVKVEYCREDTGAPVTLTNYEMLHKFNPDKFVGFAADESSILKSLEGSTRTLILENFARTPFKLAATATPAPNDFMELGNHAEFVGAMTRSEMLSMFFVHDGGETQKWRLKGHAEQEFWKWVCSWAVMMRMPSDLGYDDKKFILPAISYEQIVTDSSVKQEGMLFALPASTLHERRGARRGSITERVAAAVKLIKKESKEKWLIWCNLNDEQDAIEDALGKKIVSIRGATPEDERMDLEEQWRLGDSPYFVSKPEIFGHGSNWQHCARVLYLGLSDSWEMYFQSVRRCWRFGQKRPVKVFIVTSHQESAVVSNIKRKEADAERMAFEMVRNMHSFNIANLKATERDMTDYNPTQRMKLPEFITA